MNEVVLLLGCNMGNRKQNLNKAIDNLIMELGSVLKKSSMYDSEAWGFECEQSFINQVVVMKSALNAEDVLEKILFVENKLGRKRLSKSFTSRIIDIDILFFNKIVIKTKKLTIPHPSIHRRRFTLEPLNEIMPNWIHPIFHKSIRDLLEKCEDKLWVKKIES